MAAIDREKIRAFMREHSYMDLDADEAHGLAYGTRDNGDVGEERPGRADILHAREMRSALAIAPWCARFPGRVHVARVNTWDRLIACWRAGAISVDGTGWFHKARKGQNQGNDLRKFLRETDTASAERAA